MKNTLRIRYLSDLHLEFEAAPKTLPSIDDGSRGPLPFPRNLAEGLQS